MMKPKSKYYGNSATMVYHDKATKNDACRIGEVKTSNRVHFHSWQDATDAGYRACKICMKSDEDQ